MADPGKTDITVKTEIDTTAKKRNLDYYLAGSVALITFVVYLSSLEHKFVGWDDPEYIINNSYIRSFDLDMLRWAFSAFYAANWHPLTWISHALDYAIWGLDPLGHHLTNNILHAVNTFLVVVLVTRLIEAAVDHSRFTSHDSRPSGKSGTLPNESRKRPDFPRLTIHASLFTLVTASVTGLLFGLHPLHVESVAWVSERKDLLCALFYLLSVMSYIKYAKAVSRPPAHRSYSLFTIHYSRPYVLSLTFFILALLSKPMAVSLPVVFLILDWFPFGKIQSIKTFWTALAEKLPFFVLSFILSVITILAQKGSEALFLMEVTPFATRILVAAHSLIAYLGKMLWPFHLSPFYSYPSDVTFFSIKYFLPVLLLISITIISLGITKKLKVCLSAWCYYVITLVPVLGLVQVGRQAMADRYTYLPSLGPFLVIGLGVAWVLRKYAASRGLGLRMKSVSALIATLAFISLSYVTVMQISIWKNGVVFWSCIIDNEQPDKILFAYNNRGSIYITLGLFDKAIDDFDQIIRIDPAYHEAYSNRGYAYYFKGQFDLALKDYNSAIEINQNYAKAYYNRGSLYLKAGNKMPAMSDLQKACYLGEQEGCNALQTLSMENQTR